ncbi:Swt1 family HEPN domain-containing protein [Bryocella elongata]|nr:Swt1 family HEPN domain-containing protein [Bryocella elongata]
MTNQMLADDLLRIGAAHGVDLGHLASGANAAEDAYYPQFPARIRAEAHRMARHYELFYCLEVSVRDLVNVTLTESKGTDDWWATDCVPQQIKLDVSGRIKAEIDSGVSRRSDDELDFTTFGELGTIIVVNWNSFGGIFTSKKAVEKVVGSLNSLRNPIAHCCPLAEDEEVRLSLALRDWFRLME